MGFKVARIGFREGAAGKGDKIKQFLVPRWLQNGPKMVQEGAQLNKENWKTLFWAFGTVPGWTGVLRDGDYSNQGQVI